MVGPAEVDDARQRREHSPQLRALLGRNDSLRQQANGIHDDRLLRESQTHKRVAGWVVGARRRNVRRLAAATLGADGLMLRANRAFHQASTTLAHLAPRSHQSTRELGARGASPR